MSSEFVERYLSGECEAVWAELTSLGNLRRDDEMWDVATTIAQETMRRVRTNIRMLAERLVHLGFRFGEGLYDDEDEAERERLLADEPVHSFSDAQPALFRDEIARLEEITGGLPIALRAFYEVVGSANFVGRGPMWSELDPPRPGDEPLLLGYQLSRYWSDPLFVYSPKIVLSFHYVKPGLTSVMIAPDFNAKFGGSVSGPYRVMVPSSAADVPLDREWHKTTFVNYLRICCRWGGFPGLEFHRDKDQLAAGVIHDLTRDLVPF